MENWLLFKDTEHSPFDNMAIDELLLEEAFSFKIPILRFYSWDTPSISIGYIQSICSVLDKGYTVVRRPTGGGIVYHDIDLTYTILIPKDHYIEKLNREESYYIFHKPIITALKTFNIDGEFVLKQSSLENRKTMQCFISPTKFDVVLKMPNESIKKLAGAAQRRTKKGIIHQGSILVKDLSIKHNELTEALEKSFQDILKIEFIPYTIDKEFIKKVEFLSNTKYNTKAWNEFR